MAYHKLLTLTEEPKCLNTSCHSELQIWQGMLQPLCVNRKKVTQQVVTLYFKG